MDTLAAAISEIPHALQTPLSIEYADRISAAPSEVVVCGMGASGNVGDLLANTLPDAPIRVHKSFGIPESTPPSALILIISYSGDTTESLSALTDATARGYSVAVVTGGGAIGKYAREHGLPTVTVPYDRAIPTRFRAGSLLRGAFEVLASAGVIHDIEQYIRAVGGEPAPDGELGEKLVDRTALLYAPVALEGVSTFWKISLNETAKLAAFSNSITDMGHYELESLTSVHNPHILLFDDTNEDERIRERIRAIGNLAESRNWPYTTLTLSNPDRLALITHSLMHALSVGLLAATLRSVDPRETPLMDILRT